MKNNGLKITIVIALILSIAGLSLGFANYASNLKIESEADYQLNLGEQSPWLVTFAGPSYLSNIYSEGTTTFGLSELNDNPSGKIVVPEAPGEESIYPTCTDDYSDYYSSSYSDYCDDVEATEATMNGLNVSDIEVTFKNLASGVAYALPVVNLGVVDAYLKSITFSTNGPTCTAAAGATVSNDVLSAICDNIEIIYDYAGTEYTGTTTNISSNNLLSTQTGLETKLYIGLKSSETGLSNYTLEQVNVTIPDITLNYNSVN